MGARQCIFPPSSDLITEAHQGNLADYLSRNMSCLYTHLQTVAVAPFLPSPPSSLTSVVASLVCFVAGRESDGSAQTLLRRAYPQRQTLPPSGPSLLHTPDNIHTPNSQRHHYHTHMVWEREGGGGEGSEGEGEGRGGEGEGMTINQDINSFQFRLQLRTILKHTSTLGTLFIWHSMCRVNTVVSRT